MERKDNVENVERGKMSEKYSENVEKINAGVEKLYDRVVRDFIRSVKILSLQYKLSYELNEANTQMLLTELNQTIERAKQIIFGSDEEKSEATGIDLALLEGFNKSLSEARDIFAEGKRIRDTQMTKENAALTQLHQALEEGRKIFSGTEEEKSEMAGINLEMLEELNSAINEGNQMFGGVEPTVEATPEEIVEILPRDIVEKETSMYLDYIKDIANGKGTTTIGLIFSVPESYKEIRNNCSDAMEQLLLCSEDDYKNRYIISSKTMSTICGLINNSLNNSNEQVKDEGPAKTLGTYPTDSK